MIFRCCADDGGRVDGGIAMVASCLRGSVDRANNRTLRPGLAGIVHTLAVFAGDLVSRPPLHEHTLIGRCIVKDMHTDTQVDLN